ncbi:CbiX/SirB N-terminal domain-containing protein [Rathayibacter sp. YIM 133350]|uniref:sirohydrochlorin chelatase n=1 Tax=Rathayibacter sp. YIM 133350 TaxID=3131992 RepID=UPI00307DE039
MAGGARSTPALVILALTHGAPSGPNRAAVIALVDAIATARPDVDVSISFVDAWQSDLPQALPPALATSSSVVVPLVLSAGFHVRAELADSLGQAVLADALGPDGRLVEVLAERVRSLGILPRDSVLLAAAGSTDQRAVAECFETARMLGAALGRPVTVGFIAAASPRLHDAIEMLRAVHHGSRVVVATYLLAPGHFNDAITTAGADLVSPPLVVPDGAVAEPLVDLVLERYDVAWSRRQPTPSPAP